MEPTQGKRVFYCLKDIFQILRALDTMYFLYVEFTMSTNLSLAGQILLISVFEIRIISKVPRFISCLWIYQGVDGLGGLTKMRVI
jgi:hypothetical protein